MMSKFIWILVGFFVSLPLITSEEPIEIEPFKPQEWKLSATVYWGVEAQTNSHPTTAAWGDKFDPNDPPRWVALSRDLEEFFSYNDTLLVCNAGELSGLWVVKDRMNRRWRKKIDFLVPIGKMGRYNVEVYRWQTP